MFNLHSVRNATCVRGANYIHRAFIASRSSRIFRKLLHGRRTLSSVCKRACSLHSSDTGASTRVLQLFPMAVYLGVVIYFEFYDHKDNPLSRIRWRIGEVQTHFDLQHCWLGRCGYAAAPSELPENSPVELLLTVTSRDQLRAI